MRERPASRHQDARGPWRIGGSVLFRSARYRACMGDPHRPTARLGGPHQFRIASGRRVRRANRGDDRSAASGRVRRDCGSAARVRLLHRHHHTGHRRVFWLVLARSVGADDRDLRAGVRRAVGALCARKPGFHRSCDQARPPGRLLSVAVRAGSPRHVGRFRFPFGDDRLHRRCGGADHAVPAAPCAGHRVTPPRRDRTVRCVPAGCASQCGLAFHADCLHGVGGRRGREGVHSAPSQLPASAGRRHCRWHGVGSARERCRARGSHPRRDARARGAGGRLSGLLQPRTRGIRHRIGGASGGNLGRAGHRAQVRAGTGREPRVHGAGHVQPRGLVLPVLSRLSLVHALGRELRGGCGDAPVGGVRRRVPVCDPALRRALLRHGAHSGDGGHHLARRLQADRLEGAAAHPRDVAGRDGGRAGDPGNHDLHRPRVRHLHGCAPVVRAVPERDGAPDHLRRCTRPLDREPHVPRGIDLRVGRMPAIRVRAHRRAALLRLRRARTP